MRRLILLGAPVLVLAALGPAVVAQDAGDGPAAPAKPRALRLSLDLTSQIDGEPEPSNTFQYYLFERLSHFGIRVDSLRPCGAERLDGWIQRRAARWEKDEPDAPPATLALTGAAGCKYDDAQFFGQTQAHSFKGTVDVRLKNAAGTELFRVAFDHEWGQLPQRATKAQVQQTYNDMVFTGVLLALLHRPEVVAGVPEGKRAELRTFIDAQKQRLLGPLKERLPDCQLVTLLEGLQPPR
ncbi:MAG: hypothetical protein KF878_30960 [Planctomycetes bacterium]|nr:hypothetical protein [Planctomycetota bacterium]